jgi:PAS domain S-box-containing protein
MVHEGFMPHGYCYLWLPDLVLLHTISDSIIVLSYYSIPVGLTVLIRKRRDLSFDYIFALFAIFIFACGTTHVLQIWNIWHNNYYLEGMVKAVTAAASLLTAVILWPLLPKVITLPSPTQMAAATQLLREEIERRQESEHQLYVLNQELEQRVALRTRELQQSKDALEHEVQQRINVEQRLLEIFEATPNGLLVINSDGIIDRANHQAEMIFGYARGELDGLAIESLVPLKYRGHHVGDRQQYVQSPSKRAMGAGRDLFGQRKNGSEVPLEIGLNPISPHAGSEIIASVVDVSYRKRAEQQIRAKADALMRNNEELQQFAFIASHDLREPLRKILSFSNLLTTGRYGNFDDKGSEFITYITDAANRMQELLDSLLSYSRVTSKARPFRQVNLNTVMASVLDDMQLAINDKSATIECSALTTLDADEVQLRQLFQNLLSNSLKYSRPNVSPLIRIIGEMAAPDSYLITFTDNGIGFEQQYASQIFEVFKRLHGRGAYPGTGMGLAIVRKIVDRHGGRITAHGNPGLGSSFEILLPLHQENVQDERDAPDTAVDGRG